MSKTIAETSLISEWDFDKNLSMDPEVVTIGSNKKAWWKCKKGHNWEAVIGSKKDGAGCPYCNNKKINSENNLESRFPELAKEWDIEKNIKLPNQVFPGTIIKYWWKCKNGHSYQSAPNKRTSSNRGCPYCSGRLVTDINSLTILFPLIAKEFDEKRNIGIDVNELTVKSHKSIWWKCKKGHEWQSSISNRTRGNNCPFCNSQVSKNELRIFAELKYFFQKVGLKRKVNGFECDILLQDLNVAIEYDGVYWHKDKLVSDKRKNSGLFNAGIFLIRVREVGLPKIAEIDIIYDHNKQPILFAIKIILEILIQKKIVTKEIEKQIQKYFKREAYINDLEYRELLERLPSPIIEDSLEFKFPKLIQEWNREKNKGLLPSDVSAKSGLKVWWKCKFGHEWETTVGNRTQGGNNCPYCAHQIITNENSLAFIRPDLIQEWDFIKNNNLQPDKVFAYTTKKYWWKCKNNHEWLASPSNRASFGSGKNTGCPYCSNKKVNSQNSLEATNNILASEWNFNKNGLLKPTMFTAGSYKKVWWLCSKGHEWEALISSRNKGRGCPYCAGQKVSIEQSLYSKRPDLIREWNNKKNKGFSPKDFSATSAKRVWWMCKEGHEWETSIGYRNKSNSKCPICRKN